jgi:hypothetical protein
MKLVAKITARQPFAAPGSHWIGSYRDSRVNLAWCLRVEHLIVSVDHIFRALFQLVDLF